MITGDQIPDEVKFQQILSSLWRFFWEIDHNARAAFLKTQWLLLREYPENKINRNFLTWRVTYRSSHRRCSMKKTVLKDFATFPGKHLC